MAPFGYGKNGREIGFSVPKPGYGGKIWRLVHQTHNQFRVLSANFVQKLEENSSRK
jgi:hypothetical protein